MSFRGMSVLIYFFSYAYLFTATLHFFWPMSSGVAVSILILSLGLAIWTTRKDTTPFFLTGDRRAECGFLIFFALCLLLGSQRPTSDTDAHVYHLPSALLSNASRWYPGISHLNSHFGFPNANSLLASLFTAFHRPGLENIVNLLFWGLLGFAVFQILQSHKVSLGVSLLAVFSLLFTPDMYWQAFNMGNDLPMACLLFMGLWCWKKGRIEEAGLLLSLAGTFKLLGQIAFFAWLIWEWSRLRWRSGQVLLALGIMGVCLLRVYVATGNPLYPVAYLPIPEWGIHLPVQDAMLDNIRRWANVERSITGMLLFIPQFMLTPRMFHSSYWFFPPFLLLIGMMAYLTFRKRIHWERSLHSWGIGVTVFGLFVIWFYGSPLFRFSAGLFIFLFVAMLTSVYGFLRVWEKRILASVLAVTLAGFTFNVARHLTVKKDPLYDSAIFVSRQTPAGQPYIDSVSTYCGYSQPPCMGALAIGDKAALAQRYYEFQ
jgi:hypothetical protein